MISGANTPVIIDGGMIMTQEMQFKTIVSQYCEVTPEEMTDDLRFREDLGFSSLDFMSFLGELEDTFDVELEEEEALKILTVGEALELLERL
jgi:acyl carrier protein